MLCAGTSSHDASASVNAIGTKLPLGPTGWASVGRNHPLGLRAAGQRNQRVAAHRARGRVHARELRSLALRCVGRALAPSVPLVESSGGDQAVHVERVPGGSFWLPV